MIEKKQIDNITKKIIQKTNPYKIILYGSYAKGNYTKDSDIDLIIIKDSDLPRHKRGLEIRRLFYGMLIPLDLKVYTPDEYKKEIKNEYSFLNSVIQESKTLYDRQA